MNEDCREAPEDGRHQSIAWETVLQFSPGNRSRRIDLETLRYCDSTPRANALAETTIMNSANKV